MKVKTKALVVELHNQINRVRVAHCDSNIPSQLRSLEADKRWQTAMHGINQDTSVAVSIERIGNELVLRVVDRDQESVIIHQNESSGEKTLTTTINGVRMDIVIASPQQVPSYQTPTNREIASGLEQLASAIRYMPVSLDHLKVGEKYAFKDLLFRLVN